MRESKEARANRVAKTMELEGKVIRIDCSADAKFPRQYIKRAIKTLYCPVCGQPIYSGDFYYWFNNRGYESYACEDCPPVMVGNKVYSSLHPVAKEALRKRKYDKFVSVGDTVFYAGREWVVTAMGHISKIKCPFCILYDEEANEVYSDENGGYIAVSAVSVRKV